MAVHNVLGRRLGTMECVLNWRLPTLFMLGDYFYPNVLYCSAMALLERGGGTVVFVVVVRRHGEMSGHNLLD